MTKPAPKPVPAKAGAPAAKGKLEVPGKIDGRGRPTRSSTSTAAG